MLGRSLRYRQRSSRVGGPLVRASATTDNDESAMERFVRAVAGEVREN